jgi:hypothetical protein
MGIHRPAIPVQFNLIIFIEKSFCGIIWSNGNNRINFIPENAKGEELTSKKFKDLCVFDLLGKIVTKKTQKTSASGNTYNTYERVLYPMDYVVPQP